MWKNLINLPFTSYKDSLIFIRFEDMNKVNQIIFQPFGAGPRNCIGMRFALVEVKMAICKILQNFQLDVADDTPVSYLFFDQQYITPSFQSCFDLFAQQPTKTPSERRR